MTLRAALFSDSHGDRRMLAKAVLAAGSADMAVHLGDGAADAFLLERCAGRVIVVRGNCDAAQTAPAERIVECAGCRLCIVHGHALHVKSGLDLLARFAIQNGCDAAFFGHTHVPLLTRDYGVTLVNPGSIGYPPRGKGPSYALLEIRDGVVDGRIVTV